MNYMKSKHVRLQDATDTGCFIATSERLGTHDPSHELVVLPERGDDPARRTLHTGPSGDKHAALTSTLPYRNARRRELPMCPCANKWVVVVFHSSLGYNE